MSYLNKSVVAAVLAVGVAGTANAQFRDAASKVRGDYGFAHQTVSRSLYHARDYANDYSAYVQDAQQNDRPVSPEVAQQQAAGLGQNIQQFQNHLDTVRDLSAGDKETQASLDTIHKHVQEAAKHHATLADQASKSTVDAEASLKSADAAAKSLNSAIAEHDKLIKKLGTQQPATK